MTVFEELAAVVDRARQLEQEADAALHEQGDRAVHRQKLLDRAQLLADLPDRMAPLAAGLPPFLSEQLLAGLEEIAADARQALAVDSIFYMAVLLYPLDHEPGQPDELEALIDRLRKMAG